MTIEALFKKLRALHTSMERIGENDMGDLSYAEAALFHGATEAIDRLLDSVYEREILPLKLETARNTRGV